MSGKAAKALVIFSALFLILLGVGLYKLFEYQGYDKKETNKFTEDKSEVKIERTDDKIAKRILSETPTPPEGWSAFFVWLTKNIKYPEVAKQANQQAVVSITFIINSDGTVDDIKIKEAKNPIFEAEVLRVVRTMGKWKPGIQNNKPCKSLIEIPVVFSLG